MVSEQVQQILSKVRSDGPVSSAIDQATIFSCDELIDAISEEVFDQFPVPQRKALRHRRMLRTFLHLLEGGSLP